MIGNVYILRIPLLNNHRGTLGVCYGIITNARYEKEIAVVFPNGERDTFDGEETGRFLMFCGRSSQLKDYKCGSEKDLERDLQRGLFDHVWEGSFSVVN